MGCRETRTFGSNLAVALVFIALAAIEYVSSGGGGCGFARPDPCALQTSELLSSNLDWLDADHNGRIEPNDPAYYAIRVWLDVNGDGDSRTLLTGTDSEGRPTVNLRDETISLAIAGVTAIDFRGTNAKNGKGTYTPHVERGDGITTHNTHLHERVLTGTTLGVSYRASETGVGVVRMEELAGEVRNLRTNKAVAVVLPARVATLFIANRMTASNDSDWRWVA